MRSVSQPLPVDAVLDDVMAALREHRRVVLVAPPGSGKTTRVPPALVASGLVAPHSEVMLLQPRRVAVRSVARHLARRSGQPLGRQVGYQVRFDRRVSAATRLRVATEGILVAEMQRDPEIRHIGAVVLDEFHERSLQADLALALLVEVQEALRPDLLIVVMSATLAADPLAAWLDCPVIEAHGRQHPLEIDYVPREGDGPLPGRVAQGVLQVDGAGPTGDILAFLPGAWEIHRTAELLAGRTTREVAKLYGRAPADEQDRALRPGGRPRVVLATNIAETSLTIDGVTAVVDSGRARMMRHDAGRGLSRLETVRISRASADQRAGRAGRLGPGRVLRLWTRVEHATRPASELPEIQRVDLADLVLELRAWGRVDDLADFFYEAPSAAAVERAEELLALLGAIDGAGGDLTPLGAEMRSVPAHPRVARMLLAARERGQLGPAAWVAACLQEGITRPGSGGSRAVYADIVAAARSVALGPGAPPAGVARLARSLASRLGGSAEAAPVFDGEQLSRCLLEGWPDRVCRRVGPGRPEVVMVGGGGATVHKDSAVLADELLTALDVDAGRRGERSRALIRSASHVSLDWLIDSPLTTVGEVVAWDSGAERVVASRQARYLDLVVDSTPVSVSDRDAAAALLEVHAAAAPDRALKIDGPAQALLARMRLVERLMPDGPLPSAGERGWPAALLPELCRGRSSFADLRRLDVSGAMRERLSWSQRAELDRLAPERLRVPSSSQIRLDYGDGATDPVLAAKVQELFGWVDTPTLVDGRAPVVVHLLDPAGRPLQVTRDLRSFWTTTWRVVRAEMRSRYPKHRWPEDPLTAEPSRRTTQKSKSRRPRK